MLSFVLLLAFLAVFSLVLGISPGYWEKRPTLMSLLGTKETTQTKKKKEKFVLLQKFAIFNKPLLHGPLGRRISRDLNVGQVDMTPEEFFLIKEITAGCILTFTYPIMDPNMFFFWLVMGIAGGYMLPEFWLKGKIKKIKNAIIRELPDAIDLLRLCVNAGLDFMLALKWVVEKSTPSVMIREFHTIMQEINLGKTRRDALKDLSNKYEIADLSTLTRTLIQADKMGTSVAEALNILSEDMRLARFRRGEQMAMKAPLKMLVPLLLFIFPVVGILIAGPIFIDFIENNPMKALAGGQ